jgi:hypothetical protein
VTLGFSRRTQFRGVSLATLSSVSGKILLLPISSFRVSHLAEESRRHGVLYVLGPKETTLLS